MKSHFVIDLHDGRLSVNSSAPIISLGERGTIIGHLFSRTKLDRRVLQLEQAEVAAILASSGRSLVTDFWGGYVAIIRNESGNHILIRDASGIMPCYWRQRGGALRCSNDIEDVACWGAAASVRFSALTRYLASPQYSGDETGLEGTFELPAGHVLHVGSPAPTIVPFWSPWDFVFRSSGSGFTVAADELQEVTIKCVKAWASCFDNVVLGVSGGLDSSIVAYAAAPHTELRLLNMYADDAEGDERRYANILVDSLGLALQVGHFKTEDVDVRRPVLPHRPWPNVSHFALAIARQHAKLERSQSVSAYFSGNGGDNIFCTMRSTSPFLDRLLVEGPGIGLKDTLRDLCSLTGSDAATVLKAAWKQFLASRQSRQPRVDRSGLHPDSVANLPLHHPWKCVPGNMLPGKAGHVSFLANAQQSHELYARSVHPPHIAPLLSQPIVELCLAIPTWLWVEGGVDRSVARQAFESVLPSQLVERSSKGGPGMFVERLYRDNEMRIKNLLREGILVQQGCLDRAYIDAADDPSWRGSARTQRLLHFLAAENWCRYWEGRPTS